MWVIIRGGIEPPLSFEPVSGLGLVGSELPTPKESMPRLGFLNTSEDYDGKEETQT